ncbi:hypothetical protein HXX76_002991 [Chlamydomonas incerta]|uniref:Uncharacterized protein n=1 Tax=Chlamydomonas incerta TaxID=51695 RepID=A0A835W802_CHLIN|nr:hypothetical protein HXX76_002991 [Chlamydomonas incerta]|eukprot:KAG2442915.1 hypothetical protein HXX76_002991 [Chlamydomonas incerta]
MAGLAAASLECRALANDMEQQQMQMTAQVAEQAAAVAAAVMAAGAKGADEALAVDFLQRELKKRTDQEHSPPPRMVVAAAAYHRYHEPRPGDLDAFSVDGTMIRAADALAAQQRQRQEEQE